MKLFALRLFALFFFIGSLFINTSDTLPNMQAGISFLDIFSILQVIPEEIVPFLASVGFSLPVLGLVMFLFVVVEIVRLFTKNLLAIVLGSLSLAVIIIAKIYLTFDWITVCAYIIVGFGIALWKIINKKGIKQEKQPEIIPPTHPAGERVIRVHKSIFWKMVIVIPAIIVFAINGIAFGLDPAVSLLLTILLILCVALYKASQSSKVVEHLQ